MSKPRIAIFGDSFAANEVGDRIDDPLRVEQGFSWSNELAKTHTVTNFARPGTGLYWSYNLFLDNYKEFDKIVFVASTNKRIQINEFNEVHHNFHWSPDMLDSVATQRTSSQSLGSRRDEVFKIGRAHV